MLKKVSIYLLSASCLFMQVGCAQHGNSPQFGSNATNSSDLAVQSEDEEQIMKEATIAGTVGGVAVSALLISTVGKDWPPAVQVAVSIGGTLAMNAIARYIAMDQVSMLNDVTLENDKKEALLTKARKVNADVAKLNSELKSSITKYKKNKKGLSAKLAEAKISQENAKQALKKRKQLLNVLVKGSEQYKQFEKEVKVLEKENIKLASTIKQLSKLDVGAV
ncbi:hypothetical protein [Photobacterium leiognathi]|uniref:hypothetical protein n=1 Tax=Photobacterium leiognathi TaxID=553611 RepID=UPI00273469A4|nr:hypothetical protein [Photobacterium leiognathi]